eukprot:TRINITY_DN25768_c0_g1_i1.p1 TRINITY_DN25768_c0_g1~~TRINITY_DN25768_c0_g1_i1.p1  ORF type:complete len:269 (+),score=27.87 TRINITY_DN25768_c0_g1_i1:101-907(+)
MYLTYFITRSSPNNSSKGEMTTHYYSSNKGTSHQMYNLSQPGYAPHGGDGLSWVTDRSELSIVQTPECCARQTFVIFDPASSMRLMRTSSHEPDFCCGDCCPRGSDVFITGADGREVQLHSIETTSDWCHPRWMLIGRGNQTLGQASLRSGCCDTCGCPPPIDMIMTSGEHDYFTQPENPPECCDGMCAPMKRYDFDIRNTRTGRTEAVVSKLPLRTFSSYIRGVNNYSIVFKDPSLTPSQKATFLVLIFAADFHYWKPGNNSTSAYS